MHKHRKPIPGIEDRHRKACRSRGGGRCNCTPSYRAKISGPTGRITGPWLPTAAAAKNWRTDAESEIKRGAWFDPTRITLDHTANDFIAGAQKGTVLNRNGVRYRPSVVRGYESSLRRYVLPELGATRLSEIRRANVQHLVDALHASGLAPSTVRNAIDPLRRIFDRAVKRDLIPYSPCQNLDVPRGTGTRERVASPAEAEKLVAALDERDRALWAAALYGGLRIGEIRGLRWRQVDIDANLMHVRRSWDDAEGEQEGGKSPAAVRTVMVLPEVRRHLLAHRLATGRRDDELVFGATSERAMARSTIRSRALRAWERAGLSPITPHEARHTFGSILAAAGLDPGERQRQMGHTSGAMMDRCTHGFDGSIAAAAKRVQAFLDDERGRRTG
jgi:integrase